MDGLLGYCRQGFEPELAAELGERAAQAGIAGYARASRDDGHVLFVTGDAADAQALSRALPFRDLVFARQKLRLLAELRGLDPKDRLTPLLAALPPDLRLGDVWVEHPDSDAGKPLSALARSFGNALRPALRKAGLLSAREDPRLPRLHVCFLAGDHALLALADPRDSSPWPLGIPRLKLLPEAPSRSALKLEEAFLTLLDAGERERLLRPGMTAADLGAAPGGWTWVLTRQHLRVSSIDNGPLRQHVLDTGLVEHLRADGFHWQPSRPLDWMVCDMVEQPSKVAARMAQWFREGWCRHAVFNLKLPMKKRWQETRQCLDLFAAQAGKPLTVRARQLYHDREEITVFATPEA
ncbi:23S rRNA (cytidine(2498)-2'-O)-methyltransferase RlmM [Pseudoxanthomonas sp.]|uniref:23S rRNA (cytidine(2498)-2'-O)-methyltransferase RlmM n=1 Tax=Pseudoxanthomonas sp. TaxID=1871049 RepID=UPI0025885A38|nr:23S rRNA (cytidine(2498)-2'-O)-methyltransferase RlmM [Pseudoxanthomonas sp.]MCR6686301.1 23S rRNA (cytidine(2498)-2'-O)-methyltransferase RlmM [Pseudoxanthomonas sp.]